jgi:hypothetical protein
MSDLVHDDGMFYIQHTQNYAGDYILWWGPNGSGYTFDLDRAGLYTKAEADSIVGLRGQEKAWPKAAVQPGIERAVNVTKLYTKEAANV